MTIKMEKLDLNEERNVTLTTMIQSVNGEFGKISARPAVLICRVEVIACARIGRRR